MQRSLFLYILANSTKQQFIIVLLAGLSLPFYYVSLEMPKRVINEAIGQGAPYFPRDLEAFGHTIARLDQISFLLVLCSAFLLAVAANGGLKYAVNLYKGLLGERLLREFRHELCARVLRFPPGHFRRVSSEEITTMVTAEVEPLGGFIGDAIAVPILQGGLLLTAIVFIFVQDLVLGLAAVALFPIQWLLIPALQREVLQLGRERVRTVRRLAGRLGETVDMVEEIRTNASGNRELETLDRHLTRLLDLRYRIFRRKFFVKSLNNFLFQVTPFLFLLIGGYLVINGNLTLGALVAILAAYKDLPPPSRELLDYYQTQQDVCIKYEQIILQFAPSGMYPERMVAKPADQAQPLVGDIAVTNLVVIDDGELALEGVSLSIGRDERVAILDADGRTGEILGRALVGLIRPASGSIDVGGRKLSETSRDILARTFAFVGTDAAFFGGTVEENLFYGSGAWPEEQRRAEAMRALTVTELMPDAYDFCLNSYLDPAKYPELAEAVVQARGPLRKRLEAADGGNLVEVFELDKYWEHATVAENLLGGAFQQQMTDAELPDKEALLLSLVKREELTKQLVALGRAAADVLLSAPGGTEAGPETTDALISPEDEPRLRAALRRRQGVLSYLSRSEQRAFLNVAFTLVAGRDRYCPVEAELKKRIVEVRQRCLGERPGRGTGAMVCFRRDTYNSGLTVRENLVFGRIATTEREAMEYVEAAVDAVVQENHLGSQFVEAGLEYDIGAGGRRLSGTQRQRLALARALLKRPQVLVACRATNALDGTTELKVMRNLLAEFQGRCLVCVLDHASLARYFDRLLLFQGGQLMDQGKYEDVRERRGEIQDWFSLV